MPSTAETKGTAPAADLPLPATAELEAGIADDAPPLDFGKLDGYLRATAACDVGPVDVDPYCPAYRRYATARQRLKVRAGLVADYAALGLRFLGDASPVVRMLAAQLTTAQLQNTHPQLLAAARRERHPQVQVVLLTLLTQPAAEAGRKGLLELANERAKSAELPVRVAALQVLASQPAAYVATLSDRLARGEVAEQVTACRAVAGLTPQAPEVVELLRRTDLNKEVRAACSQGLVDALCGSADEAIHKSAWALLKAELSPATADAKRPAWQAVEALACLAKTTGGERADVLAQLRELVDAETASGFARAAAVKSLGRLGAPRDWLGELAKRYRDAQFGAAGQVRRALLDEGWLQP
ncbi:MAG: hypothetical protein HY902_03730 [Deltaproteobacteria bacterium]|nr:hypothetical protein [Deltaproteobacteria bacterium]